MLLLAVIAGVFGMHVLTAGDGPGHGMLPAPAMADGHHDRPDAAPPAARSPLRSVPGPAPIEPLAAPLPSGIGHGDMAGCVLFLVIGGAALVLLALARSAAGAGDHDRPGDGGWLDLRRRGPPDGWPRIALGVLRV